MGGEEVFFHTGPHTHENVKLVAGDFWLNVYAESLNVGADLLSGTGLAKYVALRRLIALAEAQAGYSFDYVLIDLPPSFGALVRATFYSSDYFIVPCTSDNFSAYCVGLIGQMVPNFIRDWKAGLSRFREANPHLTDFDLLGQPKFAGWVFNGFDTARARRTQGEIAAGVPLGEREMHQADQTFHDRMAEAIRNDLVMKLQSANLGYQVTASGLVAPFRIGDIEDANVLIQNSLWQNVPLGQLASFPQLRTLRDRASWAQNQLEQIELLGNKFHQLSQNLERALGTSVAQV